MGNELLDTRWDEVLGTLEAEGLPKEKAREIFPKAIGFIFEVDRKKKGSYLSEDTLRTYRETLGRLTGISQKYPATKGLLAHLYLEEVKKEGQLGSIQIIRLCEKAVRVGIIMEWVYLGKEVKRWRVAGEEKGEIGIHPNTLNAGVHIFDFRPEDRAQRRTRHFLPAEWRNREQLALTSYLAGGVKRIEEAYRAAHPRLDKPGTTTAEAVVVAGEPPVKPVLETKPPRRKRVTSPENRKDEPGTKASKTPKIKGGRGGEKANLRKEVETSES